MIEGGEHTFVFVVVDELVRGDHVHETHYAAVLEVSLGLGAGQHRDSTHTAVEPSSLLHTNSRARDLEVAVAKGDVVETFDDGVDHFVVGILAECDTLDN